MSCPHSTRRDATAEHCSLCRGAAPRVVTRNEATGTLAIDGVEVDRAFVLPTSGPQRPMGRRKGAAKADLVEDEET